MGTNKSCPSATLPERDELGDDTAGDPGGEERLLTGDVENRLLVVGNETDGDLGGLVGGVLLTPSREEKNRRGGEVRAWSSGKQDSDSSSLASPFSRCCELLPAPSLTLLLLLLASLDGDGPWRDRVQGCARWGVG